MTKSWNNSDVVLLTSATKTVANYTKNHANLWTDAANSAIYTWGGEASYGLNVTAPQLWRFTDTAPGTPGAGRWALAQPTNPGLFSTLTGTFSGAAVSARGVGFLLGGISTPWTQPGRADSGAVPGLVTYDMAAQAWGNDTADVGAFPALAGAAAHYAPTFGDNGLVFVLGGSTSTIVGDPGTVLTYYDLRNLTFFDPKTKRRYSQMATGDFPPAPRVKFCTAGFEGPKGSYEL